MVVVGSLLWQQVGGSLPAFSLFWGLLGSGCGVPSKIFAGYGKCPLPGAAVRGFSLIAVFWGLESVVSLAGAFYGGVGCLYMFSGFCFVYEA